MSSALLFLLASLTSSVYVSTITAVNPVTVSKLKENLRSMLFLDSMSYLQFVSAQGSNSLAV